MASWKLAVLALCGAVACALAEGDEKAEPETTAAPEPEEGAEPCNVALVVSVLTAIIAIGVGLMVVQTPAEMRTPAKMFIVKTRNGMEGLQKVILPNLIPSLTVTLVSIPLSLALGIASGASPSMGIATAVMGGLVSGAFGDSAFNIVGPAGALVGILMKLTAKYGAEVLPWISLISGVMIVLALLTRVHQYCMFMPKAVFEGFTVSVALTIGLGQTDFAFGLTPNPPQPVEGLELSPGMWKLGESFKAFHGLQWQSTLYFLIGFIAMQILFKVKPTIPWMVPYFFVSVLLGWLSTFTRIGLLLLGDKYNDMSFMFATELKPLPEIISAADDGSLQDILMGAVSVTIVAVLETLISAQIAKNRSKMPYDQDKELQGLALSHFACGICGLMPPTGVFVRTSVNVATGATHKTSQFMQGIWVLIFSAAVMPALAYIPQGGIAAILVTASVRMVPWGYVFKLLKEHKWWFGLLCVVALVCWTIDSVDGLVIGTMVALLVTGKETARGHAELSVTAANHERLSDNAPKMISIDAFAVDDVDLARREAKRGGDSDDEDSSDEDTSDSDAEGTTVTEMQAETAAFKRQASDTETSGKTHSHMERAAPEFDFVPEAGAGTGFDRQESGTTHVFRDSENQALQPTSRGDRVFVYKFLGQLDFLSGDRHADRFQTMLASGPKAVVIAMQNVPWVDPDGMEALREMMVMLEDNGVQVYIAGARKKVVQALQGEAWYKEKIGSKRIFPTESSALIAADPPGAQAKVVPGPGLMPGA